MRVIQQDAQDVSPPLTELVKMPVAEVAGRAHEAEPVRPIPHMRVQSTGQVADPVVQSATGGPLIPTPSTGFEGMGTGMEGFSVDAAPPDPDGDIGPNHYVQIVNSSVTIFNRSGGIVMGPITTRTFWSGFGGQCANTNDGDGVVRYDRYADRWVVSQFSVNSGNGLFYQCIAVSTSPDPTGSYNRYQYSFNTFIDYPKIGLWPDAYYFTYNLFNTTFLGAQVCAVDRAEMIAGAAATQVCFTTSDQFGGLLPEDADGPTPPPAGEPNCPIALDTNALDRWCFQVDFHGPSTFTGPTTIPIAAYTPLCNGGTCVVEPGTTNQFDSLADRLMNRAVYRKFPDHEALLVTHAVTAGGGGGVRWYELRNPNATMPTMFQQGTYAPDSAFRWMSSAAFDQAGNIGLGFSISSSTINPSIRYTGRLVTDAAGTMGQGEATIVAGTGSQTGNLTRWGDYSSMNIDPNDDCTFWYTNEYLGATGSFNWRTRIGAFRFPGCGGIGRWTPLTHAPPAYLDTCLLLTDGSVMCHQYNSNLWHRLRPDAFGSYGNGTWDTPAIPAMPNGNDSSFGCVNCTYAPLYYSSAVLPDGRAIVIGGEYINLSPVWTNIGFIYDPVANTWSSQLTDMFGGGNVGDAQGKVLQDGTFVLTNISTTNMEALNPATGVFTAKNPTGKLDINDEENWNMLYDGTVLTVDSRIASSFERYTPSTNIWGSSGATPVNMADTGGLPVANSDEVGPCALRPDNKLVCFSGNSLGQNAIYNPSTNTWSHTAAMDFPAAPGGGHFAMADGSAAALPNGNILVMASPVTNAITFNAPSHFYEMDLATNTLLSVTDSSNAASFAAYQGRMLVLPTGEVLLTAFNQSSVQDVMLYSNGGAPAASSRPVITFAPATIAAGGVYSISGKLFNGFSEGASYGDDAQSATNYPLVRITNTATRHVFYARTFNHSRMGVEPTGGATVVTTSFHVPTSLESGPATLVVVANGIASLPLNVNR